MELTGRRVGYARVSTEDQDCDGQRRALAADGCRLIFADMMSGTKAQRPEFDAALETLRRGDTLVVFKLDRLGRSVINLSTLVSQFKERGIHLRSLTEAIDTKTASGMMIYHVMSSFAEYERALIVERTNLGLDAARARGVQFGNPAMRRRDPVSIAKIKASLAVTHGAKARKASKPWIAIVRRHRPHRSWGDVCRLISHHVGRAVNVGTVTRQCRHLVALGDLPATVFDRKPMKDNADAGVVARRIAAADPSLSLRAIARELDGLGVRPVRAGTWSAQTIKALLKAGA